MRAVVRRNKQLVCDEIAELEPAEGQVLVRTLACGICGSDLHALHHMEHMIELSRRAGGADGGFDPTADTVFGHEFCAEILDHGPGSPKALKAGTRVVSVPATLTAGGVELLGFSNRLPGGFAERMLLSEALVLEVPNGLATDQAALTEPFAVGLHAVAKARMDANSVALVVGCGPVGLAVIAALKAQGHGPVIAADFSPRRRAAAERLGADIVIDPAKESPHDRWEALGVPKARGAQQMIRMMGGSFGRPVVFECVGAPGLIQQIVDSCPMWTRIFAAGGWYTGDTLDCTAATHKGVTIQFGGGPHPEDWYGTLDAICEGRLDPLPSVGAVIGLDEIADALEQTRRGQGPPRVVVHP